MDPADAQGEGIDRPGALELLNKELAREGFEAFYADDNQCHLKHIATKTVVAAATNPHRPFSPADPSTVGLFSNSAVDELSD